MAGMTVDTPVATRFSFRRAQTPSGVIAAGLLLMAGIAGTAVLAFVLSPEGGTRPFSPVPLADLTANEPSYAERENLFLVELDDGGVLALSAVSTHLGCTIDWLPDHVQSGVTGWFRDPCSGSNFDLSGIVHSGPAPRGMDRYPTEVRGGDVVVETDTKLCQPWQGYREEPYTSAGWTAGACP